MGQIFQHFDFEGRRGAMAMPSVLSEAFSPHSLTVLPTLKKPASFTHAKLGQGSLSLLNIPTRSEVNCDKTDSYFFVFVKGGDLSYELDEMKFQAQAGQGVVINCGQSFRRLSESTGANLTVVKLSPAQLHKQLPVPEQEPSPWNIKFAPRFEISSLSGGTLWRCVQYVQSELTSLDADHDLVENHLVNLEALLVKTILDTLGRESSLAQEVDIRNVMPAYMKKVLSYMQSHCQERIQLKDLSRIGDVSERTVGAGLKRYLHTSPAQYLKQLRLKHVNDDLRCATANTTVTDVAMRWGFNQLGWFSAEYRKEFGEAPSATLRSAQLRSL